MGTIYYNGLHWCSPINDTARPQYVAGQQFSSAFVLAAGDISYGGCATGYNGWKEQCNWIRQNGARTGEIVLRLYWPSGTCMNGDPGATLGQAFYYQIVEPAIDQFGIRNFQVLNELNLEYEPSKGRAALGGDMFNLAWHIKHQATLRGRGTVWLGFPGPGGNSAQPSNPDWNAYWDFYKTYITMGTDQGPAYNWLAVHGYEFTAGGLANLMTNQYNSLVGKLSQYPQRWTEYGIPMDVYCGVPCGDLSKFQQRATDYRSAIQTFRNNVIGRVPAGPDVWSVFCYLAFNSDAGSQAGRDGLYELVKDNSNLQPAVTLAGAF